MFDYVKYFDRLLYRTVLGLLRYDQIDIDVGMDEVSVGGASDGALDAHQTVLFGPLKNGFAVQVLAVPWIIDVGAYPAYVFASSKAPFPKTKTTHIQSVAAAAPKKHEAPICRHFTDIQFHYLRRCLSLYLNISGNVKTY